MSKVPNGYEVISLFESYAPKSLALEGDKIGLQIGTLNKPVSQVMMTLDVMEEVVDEAIEKGADLIIAHHPPLFRSLKNVITDTPSGRIIEKCIKHDIAVYAAHTNLDVADGGVNDMLAGALGLTDTKLLAPTYTDELKRLIAFVPETHKKQVKKALGDAGAGHIGNYSHCTFTTEGTGSFLPLEGSHPYLGEPGEMEEVHEVKLETIYPKSREKMVLSALKKAHPYEEVAYDIIPLENEGIQRGLGRVGQVPEEMTLKRFAEHVKQSLNVDTVRIVGNPDDTVKKAAVLGGDGNKYIHQAKFSGADVFVTGDIYYHTAHDAMMLGLNIIDAGHHIESIMKQGAADVLLSMANEKSFELSVFASESRTDPFLFL
ncbi:Nif3-like dinuclear metal center hexameric protein [Bacillus lacus]|uniref:GTP cyclohydrolase 1 type 2 homolog n=1 Tax=Metabacillus lacus TaxID=1983721 RepID=A0A7X2LY11_9BACI|nr:Nif3-like dinuclear metal center hexameric protein [Metabacillus lacus]MRX71288.1 Nif3-like dinuclear metal center hexameric protein [Metabacillus lacus]